MTPILNIAKPYLLFLGDASRDAAATFSQNSHRCFNMFVSAVPSGMERAGPYLEAALRGNPPSDREG